MGERKPTITVIGTGALGSVLARALDQQDFSIVSLYNRTLTKAEKIAGEIEIGHVKTFPEKGDEVGELVFLAVSDNAIARLAERLAGTGVSFENKIVVHCSGNEESGILSQLKKHGAQTAAFHPLQTFSEASVPGDFEGIYISLEGDKDAVTVLKKLARELGANPFEISGISKPYLHAAAVMASNYLMALFDTAGKIAGLGELDPARAREALLPLAKTALQNASEKGPVHALSGPIARGDIETVKTHLEILQNEQTLYTLYRQLGLRALEMAGEKGSISDERYKALYDVLQSDPGE